ncbi:NUDIX domain-containing protein [Streptomyces roseoverticillatus]|uniref:NUDIX domain-containing protein n=1 Tax=Streptomyces roseoverticillatus TaxID=66429 RepID=UPI0033E4E426
MTYQGRIRNAASGLVVRDEHVLLVREGWPRPGTWWLPPAAATRPEKTWRPARKREVFEETGCG